MQLGFVGLGKMGGNMVHRIHRGLGPRVRGSTHTRTRQRGGGPRRRRARVRSRTWSRSSSRRGRCGSWCPRATRRRARSRARRAARRGDTIVDGGNTRWTDDKRRQEPPRARHPLRGRGRSGGVWGSRCGYCMMVGGDDEAVERLSPSSTCSRRRPPRSTVRGWGHFGPTGAGPLRERWSTTAWSTESCRPYAEGFLALRRCEYELETRRSPTSGCRARWSAPGSASGRRGPSSWRGNDLARLEPSSRTPARGRWTVGTRSTSASRRR
jgi:6-phosphogluconate dehydrogenase